MSRPPHSADVPASDPDSGSAKDDPGAGPSATGRPRGVVIVSLIVAAEGLVLLGAAGLYIQQLLTGAPVASFWGAVFTLGLLLVCSTWLLAVGHFLFRGYRWTKAAALVAQLIVLAIGVPTISGGYLLPGFAMVVPAVLAIVLLFDKRLIAFVSRTGGSPPAL